MVGGTQQSRCDGSPATDANHGDLDHEPIEFHKGATGANETGYGPGDHVGQGLRGVGLRILTGTLAGAYMPTGEWEVSTKPGALGWSAVVTVLLRVAC